MVRCEKRLWIDPTRPRARGVQRFSTSDLPTWASATISESTSSWWLFSALATADCNVFLTSRAMRLRLKVRSASAADTFLPRINWATRLSFCGEMRMVLVRAFASLVDNGRSRFGLPMAQALFAFLSPAVWPWKVRVGANSPNLCPTMSSLTSTGMCLLPL